MAHQYIANEYTTEELIFYRVAYYTLYTSRVYNTSMHGRTNIFNHNNNSRPSENNYFASNNNSSGNSNSNNNSYSVNEQNLGSNRLEYSYDKISRGLDEIVTNWKGDGLPAAFVTRL